MNDAARSISNYASDLWQFRYFWLSMVKIDLETRYRRSFLGLGWSLLKPIGMTAVICIVFATLFQKDISFFGPFVLIGMTFWGFITETIVGGCLAFHTAEGYIRQMRVPLAMFPLRVALGAGFHFAVLMPVALIAVAMGVGITHPWLLFSLIGSLSLLFVLGWSLAILSGLITVHFPDMRYILELALQILFYLTPIIYPADLLRHQRVGALLLDLNPFAYLLELIRRPLLEGLPPTAMDVGVSVGFTLCCAALAVACLSWLERRLVFWL